jgi:hypothetical protein
MIVEHHGTLIPYDFTPLGGRTHIAVDHSTPKRGWGVEHTLLSTRPLAVTSMPARLGVPPPFRKTPIYPHNPRNLPFFLRPLPRPPQHSVKFQAKKPRQHHVGRNDDDERHDEARTNCLLDGPGGACA